MTPRLPRTFVPRRQLFERLDDATCSPLTLLVAPAGAGKTVGVTGWLHHVEAVSETVWIHADPGWTSERLGAAIDAARTSDGSRLVVVDDAHALPASATRLLDRRLSEAPEDLRLLLLSRWDLPFNRLVPELLGHFTILRGEILRMDDEEAAALIVEHSRCAVPDVVRAITAHAEGWCAALVLTSRAVSAAPDPVAAVQRYGEREAHVADRVASEAFAALHARERHLLLCLAAEELVSASTAALLSHDSGAGDVLVDLETTGLLVSRAGTEDDVQYRIHPLLAEVVRRRLAAGGVDVARARATVGRAVRLDLARGDSTRAFDRLVAVGDVEQAAAILATEGVPMVLRGQGPAIAAFVRRHADLVAALPSTWFTVALDRWIVDDLESSGRWLDRILAEGRDAAGSAMVASVRLMRSRLGLEPIDAAVAHARQVVDTLPHEPVASGSGQEALPVLLIELGICQNWLGDLAGAEANLTAVVGMTRSRGLPAVAAAATSHLALTEYMAGRERTCATVAAEVFGMVDTESTGRSPFAEHRAQLALLLTGLVDVPAQLDRVPSVPEIVPTLSGDLCTRFWLRMRDARLALLAGSVAGAERSLVTPLGLPVTGDLPLHLRVAVLVERAFLASLSSDPATLRDLERELHDLGVDGEAALVAGLRADLDGDRRAAATSFAAAAESVRFPQPASRGLALTCLAQLLDAIGEPEAALGRLREAALATEMRRNGVPFLGWSHQGTPIVNLLDRLSDIEDGHLARWVGELATAARGRPDVAAIFAPTTATARERDTGPDVVMAPTLSPREREVLNQLARGATYADIAAHLYVSENTVKTHVSSLYGKLAAARRSEALAIARRLNLL